MLDVKTALINAISQKRELTITHKERGRISIRPLKVGEESVIADIVKADLLGDAPAKNVRLALKDLTLPVV